MWSSSHTRTSSRPWGFACLVKFLQGWSQILNFCKNIHNWRSYELALLKCEVFSKMTLKSTTCSVQTKTHIHVQTKRMTRIQKKADTNTPNAEAWKRSVPRAQLNSSARPLTDSCKASLDICWPLETFGLCVLRFRIWTFYARALADSCDGSLGVCWPLEIQHAAESHLTQLYVCQEIWQIKCFKWVQHDLWGRSMKTWRKMWEYKCFRSATRSMRRSAQRCRTNSAQQYWSNSARWVRANKNCNDKLVLLMVLVLVLVR